MKYQSNLEEWHYLVNGGSKIVTISRIAMILTESDSSKYALFDLYHGQFAKIRASYRLHIQIISIIV